MQKNKPTGIAAAVMLALSASTAVRAETDPYTLAVQETVTHDTNVFRAPDGNGEVPHDWISTTSVIAGLDQPISRQRLKLNGEFDLNRFKNQHALDSTAHSLTGELDWSTIGDLSGELGASQSRQLYRSALDNGDTVTTEANLQTISQAYLRAHMGVVTRWTVNAGTSWFDRTFSVPQYAYNDLRHTDVNLGTTFRDTPDLALSLMGRHTSGSYHNLNDDYSRNDFTLGVNYAPTGATTVNASAGLSRETHTLASQRDHRDWIANLQWRWVPAGRTVLTVSAIRDNDTGASDQPFFFTSIVDTDARIRTAFSSSLQYEVSAKIRATASLGYTHRSLDSSLAIPGLPAQPQHGADRLYTAGLGLDWQPTRAVDLSCNASRERRGTSGQVQGLTYAYSVTTVACTGQFAFN